MTNKEIIELLLRELKLLRGYAPLYVKHAWENGVDVKHPLNMTRIDNAIKITQHHLWEDKEKWEKACKEWLKGCTCSSLGQQEDCAECTKAFHDHLRKLAADEGYEELDSMTPEHCICGEELDALGICKALPYY